MIPRFLVCDSHDHPELEFVLHTQFPRFLAQTRDETHEYIRLEPVMWFDSPGGLNEMQLARLMREMGDWFAREVDSYPPGRSSG